MSRIGAYAFICRLCDHRVVFHTSPVEDLHKGLYSCQLCDCVITQDSPVKELTKGQYEAWKVNHQEAADV